MRRVAASGQPPESVRKQMLERAAQLQAQLPETVKPELGYASALRVTVRQGERTTRTLQVR